MTRQQLAKQGRTRPRVARVLGALDIGGAELRTIELLPHLVAEGIEVHFVTLSGRRGSLADVAERLGAQVHPMPLGRSFPARFTQFIRETKISVVHSDVATFSGPLLVLAAVAGVRVRVAHFRSDGDGHPDSFRRQLQRQIGRRLVRRYATHILGVSPGSLTYGYGLPWLADPRCSLVPNGVDCQRLQRQ